MRDKNLDLSIWYDDDANERIGKGWCWTYNPGGHIYRYESLWLLLESLSYDHEFMSNWMTDIAKSA
jgi:hypothetical protein